MCPHLQTRAAQCNSAHPDSNVPCLPFRAITRSWKWPQGFELWQLGLGSEGYSFIVLSHFNLSPHTALSLVAVLLRAIESFIFRLVHFHCNGAYHPQKLRLAPNHSKFKPNPAWRSRLLTLGHETLPVPAPLSSSL